MAIKCLRVSICVHMYVCVCFPNWTGTVAEVKRGQLKKGRWPGGSTEIELAGGLGLWESIRETEFFTSKTAYSLDKRKPCSHATAAHTHTHSTFSGSFASHEMNIHPLSYSSLCVSAISLAPCMLNISGVMRSEGNIDKAFGEMEWFL